MSAADRARARANGRGDGSSPEAEYLRELRAAHRTQTNGSRWDRLAGGTCPDCGELRRTAETLRVHRWLAHDVRAAA